MSVIHGLRGAPKYFAVASCSIVAVHSIVTVGTRNRNYDDISHQFIASLGSIYAYGAVGYNAAATVFNRHIVVDALYARPADAVSIMRAAGGRAGVCTAATMAFLHIAMESTVSSSYDDIPVLMKMYMGSIMAAFAFPFTLPLLGVSYVFGAVTGNFIGERMLYNRCFEGRLFSIVSSMYTSNPILVRLLLGSSVVLALLPHYYQTNRRRYFSGDGAASSTPAPGVWVYEKHWSSRSSTDIEGIDNSNIFNSDDTEQYPSMRRRNQDDIVISLIDDDDDDSTSI